MRGLVLVQLQGWYNWLQRDEVVAEWEEVQGRRSLHVHCHVSGGHALLGLIAGLRSRIFRRELPVVLMAFVHGDGELFGSHPELEEATVWVYFHSDLPEFNRVECWGPLRDAASSGPPSSPQPPAPEERRSASAASLSRAQSRGSVTFIMRPRVFL